MNFAVVTLSLASVWALAVGATNLKHASRRGEEPAFVIAMALGLAGLFATALLQRAGLI